MGGRRIAGVVAAGLAAIAVAVGPSASALSARAVRDVLVAGSFETQSNRIVITGTASRVTFAEGVPPDHRIEYQQTMCIEVADASGEYQQSGCGEASVEVDPALEVGTVRGTVETEHGAAVVEMTVLGTTPPAHYAEWRSVDLRLDVFTVRSGVAVAAVSTPEVQLGPLRGVSQLLQTVESSAAIP